MSAGYTVKFLKHTPAILFSLFAAGGCALAIALWRSGRFDARLNGLEAEIKRSRELIAAREDLPPEVLELAVGLGVRREVAARFVTLKQSGSMWQSPSGKAIGFRAHQTISTTAPEFLWRAMMDPFGSVWVADYLVEAEGGLEARLGGAVPVAHEVGTEEVDQGEMLRYLAELPWNPDAILANGSLDWTVVDARTLKVAAGIGARRGEVTLSLNDDGLVQEASALSRVYITKQGRGHCPWRGRFWDYQTVDGRRLPIQAEVAWLLDEGEFVYWRGKLLDWTCH